MINKKSQAWGIDLMVAMAIFSTVIFVFFIYSINQTGDAKEILESLKYDARIISNNILSTGYPIGWNENNVSVIGILSDDEINETKLKSFYDMTIADYQNTRVLFKTKYDYFFFLSEDMIMDSVTIEGIGKPGTDKDAIDARNIIKITRYVTYSPRGRRNGDRRRYTGS